MRQDLDDFKQLLTGFLGNLENIVKVESEYLDKNRELLSPEERKVVNYFEPKIMEAAKKGDMNEISKLVKKANERIKEVQNAGPDK